jgi:hypothetical protein
MSASSPFRSHLLQQWTKGGRSPIGVATWLKKAIDEDTEEDNSNPRPQTQSSNLYRSPQTLSSKDASLSSMHTSWSASVECKKNEVKNHDVLCSTGLSSAAVASDNHEEEGKKDLPLGSLKVDRNYTTRKLYSDAINSMMIPRGGAAASKVANDERRELLKTAIDRAVRVAQIKCSSQNGEVVPFAFRRFFSNSQSSEHLTEIGSRVNKLAQTKNNDDEHNKAMNNKIKEWSNNNVPAFIVALVHNNQRATNEEELNCNDPFEAMEYSPPETEQNLEDVSSCLPLSTTTRSILLRN